MESNKIYLLITSRRKKGAFGVIFDFAGKEFAVCLMRTFDPDNSTVLNKGTYECTKTTFHEGGYETFEIHVEGHTRVLFHKGNWETDSLGCVLLGEAFEELNGKDAIAQSGAAFAEFWSKYREFEKITLSVDEFKGNIHGVN